MLTTTDRPYSTARDVLDAILEQSKYLPRDREPNGCTRVGTLTPRTRPISLVSASSDGGLTERLESLDRRETPPTAGTADADAHQSTSPSPFQSPHTVHHHRDRFLREIPGMYTGHEGRIGRDQCRESLADLKSVGERCRTRRWTAEWVRSRRFAPVSSYSTSSDDGRQHPHFRWSPRPPGNRKQDVLEPLLGEAFANTITPGMYSRRVRYVRRLWKVGDGLNHV